MLSIFLVENNYFGGFRVLPVGPPRMFPHLSETTTYQVDVTPGQHMDPDALVPKISGQHVLSAT
jgi:hypothetical protein